jgi:NADH dehydrogenase
MTEIAAALMFSMPPTAKVAELHRVVIVGGGAAGLELATKLGRAKNFDVTLVDRARTHIWKPKLHEIAAGSMDPGREEVGYLAHARRHGFTFRMGELQGLDRQSRKLSIGAYRDSFGELITPPRDISYDTLIFAIGSQNNDLGTPGVSSHAMRLESLSDAVKFNRRMTNACFRAQAQSSPVEPKQLSICIIGAGATGVELAAELESASGEIFNQPKDQATSLRLNIHLIEAADRILPALNPKVSAAAHRILEDRGISVHTSAFVDSVEPTGPLLKDGRKIAAEITVWAAGVKAPEILKSLDGLETNRSNQLVVLPNLQTTLDESIFAIGDCAACLQQDGKTLVPPRAQAATQQADFMVKGLSYRLAHRAIPAFRYRDLGSLISLGDRESAGTLMGVLAGPGLFVEGAIAKAMYVSLFKKHQVTLHGWRKVLGETLAKVIAPSSASRIKLH